MSGSTAPLAVQPRRYSLRIGGTLFDPNDFNAIGADRPAYVKPSAIRVGEAVARSLRVDIVLVHHAHDGDREEEIYRPSGANVLVRGSWASS
jgi:hypothetical protein